MSSVLLTLTALLWLRHHCVTLVLECVSSVLLTLTALLWLRHHYVTLVLECVSSVLLTLTASQLRLRSAQEEATLASLVQLPLNVLI